MKPAQCYTGARYPSLADYLKQRAKGRKLSAFPLATALIILSALLAGCGSSSSNGMS